MDIKIVGKKKRKRSANVTSAFNGTNNNNSNDNNNNKNSDTKTIDKPKIITIPKQNKQNTTNTNKKINNIISLLGWCVVAPIHSAVAQSAWFCCRRVFSQQN